MNTNNLAVRSIYRTFSGPWHGDPKIILGIDIGTTYSGVAFTYVRREHEQMLHRVDQWPGQEGQHFNGKIPSIVWYDSGGKPMSFGAEALTSETQEQAEDSGWQLAQHFKLHLHPPTLHTRHKIALQALPNNVSLKQIYSDFLGYLLRHTHKRFKEVIADGEVIWESYSKDMDIVIAHPNGWGMREQAFMRQAVLAGLATNKKPDSQIHFVTEAEASVHFCMHYTSLKSCLEPEISFAVCDAGGSTVDTTVYTVSGTRPKLQLHEKRASACVQAGAVFLDYRAELYLRQHFEGTGLSEEKVDEYVAAGVHDFKYREKLRFAGPMTELRLKVAGSKLRDEHIGVRSGSLKVSGSVVQAHMFDPCVKDIVDSVNSQVLTESVSYLILVGGFGNNPYLIQQLRANFESSECRVTTPNEEASKAVAEGAIIWYCADNVVKRAPRLAYGVEILTDFDPDNPDHRLREKVVSADYKIKIAGCWSQIIPKGIPVDCDSFVRKSYVRFFPTPSPDLDNIVDYIFGYSGEDVPNWVKTSSELEPGFHDVCTVVTDLSGMRGMLQQRLGRYGDPYWALRYDICIRFGRTELEAFLEWVEEGTTKTGLVKIVPIPELELL